jgi:hypothetical protein
MPDIAPVPSLKASQLVALDAALSGIFPLSPPPTPKGRYALSKAAKVIGPAHVLYEEQKLALLTKHALKDADGKAVTNTVGNTVQFDMGRGFGITTPAFAAEFAEMNDEAIELTGCRMITHAELGDCPITVQQETALLGVLLEDDEP